MTNTNTANETKIVTLPVNAAYQPVYPDFQYDGRTCQFVAHKRHFQVGSGLGTTFHGNWPDRDAAQSFAWSLSGEAQVLETEPYWYVPAFGCVE